jgi:hypothetical protein
VITVCYKESQVYLLYVIGRNYDKICSDTHKQDAKWRTGSQWSRQGRPGGRGMRRFEGWGVIQ